MTTQCQVSKECLFGLTQTFTSMFLKLNLLHFIGTVHHFCIGGMLSEIISLQFDMWRSDWSAKCRMDCWGSEILNIIFGHKRTYLWYDMICTVLHFLVSSKFHCPFWSPRCVLLDISCPKKTQNTHWSTKGDFGATPWNLKHGHMFESHTVL